MSSGRETLRALAKALIGLAWEDGKVTLTEMNVLKDVTFQMPEMTAEDWAELALYWLAPIDAEGRGILFDELKTQLASTESRAYALDLFTEMVKLDGRVTDEETQALTQARQSLDKLDESLETTMARLLESVLGQRSGAMEKFMRRDSSAFDQLRSRFDASTMKKLGLDDFEMEKLALAGALMAQIAYADQEVSDDELRVIDNTLQRDWSLHPEHAQVIADCAVDAAAQQIDRYRLFREFYEITLPQERIDFLHVLYLIANADGNISPEEKRELERIGQVLKIDAGELAHLGKMLPRV